MNNEQKVLVFIEHHGVKGMKWGVRRPRKIKKIESLKRGVKRGPESRDYKKTVPLRNRRSEELTNEQLRLVNNRINLENNYTKMNPRAIKQGALAAASVLAAAKAGKKAYDFYKSPSGQVLIKKGRAALKITKAAGPA